MEHDPRNNLAYWFPPASQEVDLLRMFRPGERPIRVPKTVITTALEGEISQIMRAICDVEGARIPDFLISTVRNAARRISPGGPWFLRNGYFSGKHDFERTCMVRNLARVGHHIYAIAEMGEMVSPIGFPLGHWVVREYLPVLPAFHAFGPRSMLPIVREFRLFAESGEVKSYQPYWPADAIRLPNCDDWKARLELISHMDPKTLDLLCLVARRVSANRELRGVEWSIDFLEGADGYWYLIDMALGRDSYRSPAEIRLPV